MDYAPGATTSSGAELASSSNVTAAPPTPVIVTRRKGTGDTRPADDKRYGTQVRIDSKVWI